MQHIVILHTAPSTHEQLGSDAKTVRGEEIRPSGKKDTVYSYTLANEGKKQPLS